MRFFAVALLVKMLLTSCYDTPYVQGERLYTIHCRNCHMEDGSGLESLIKPLNTSQYLNSNDIVCIIRSGILDTIRNESDFLPKEMPAFKKLSPVEMTNLVNYINYKWHTGFREKTILEIESTINQCNTSGN